MAICECATVMDLNSQRLIKKPVANLRRILLNLREADGKLNQPRKRNPDSHRRDRIIKLNLGFGNYNFVNLPLVSNQNTLSHTGYRKRQNIFASRCWKVFITYKRKIFLKLLSIRRRSSLLVPCTCGYSLWFPGYQIRPVINFEASWQFNSFVFSCFRFQTWVSWWL